MDMRGRHRSIAGQIFDPTGEVFVRDPKNGKASLLRVCPSCDKEFYARKAEVVKGGGKYCSRVCYGIASNRQVDCVCRTCKSDFHVSKGSYDRGEGKYCSRQCAGIGNKSEKVALNCQHCGDRFWVMPKELKHKRKGGGVSVRMFCSKECSEKARMDGCVIRCGWKKCNNEFYVPKHEVEHKKFCSRKCMGESHTGPDGPCFKPDKVHRNGQEFSRKDKKKILDRYNWRCPVSGKTMIDGTIHIHHIIPISEGGTNDISNGIPLEETVHKQVHDGEISLLPYIKV